MVRRSYSQKCQTDSQTDSQTNSQTVSEKSERQFKRQFESRGNEIVMPPNQLRLTCVLYDATRRECKTQLLFSENPID